MGLAEDKLESATTRPLALRRRPDLVIRPQLWGADRYWVVKDPVALTYFQLRDEEHAILQMLDGRRTLAEIKKGFEEAFAPLQMSLEQLQAFLGKLYRLGLVVAEAPGQGEELFLRRGGRRRQIWFGSLSNVLAIRLPGVDPEPFLRWLYPKCRWLFTSWVFAVCVALALSAGALVAVQFDVLVARLPEFHAFFSPRNVVWLAAALALAKVLHELGHAMTCKHLGGECHEIGIMLLVFTPCLFCNVSDAWMLPSKWRRIAISAAGILVEVVLASVCTFLWWFSERGLFNTLCLNMLFVCSINTLLFNGNPLLRYDGYFILSDLLEVPNLAQQSRTLVRRGLARFFCGAEMPRDRSLPERRHVVLAVYGAASTAYRWFVVIAILWFCYRVLEPYNLELIAWMLAMTVLVGMVAMPVVHLALSLRDPVWRRKISRFRSFVSCTVFLMGVLALALIPLPFHVRAPVVLGPQDAHRVYVVVPGTLAASVRSADEVEPGQQLARLVNLDIRRDIAELVGQRNQQRLRLENLRLRLAEDPSVASQIPTAQEALADIEERLRERRHDEQRLVLRAPTGGTVLPPPWRPDRPYTPGRLETWRRSPLEQRNLGSYLDTGTLFCLVGDPARLEALMVIDQADMKFVRNGQRVRLQLDQVPGETLEGTIAEIAKTDLELAPRELAAGTRLPVRIDEEGNPRPRVTSYQARVLFEQHDHVLLTGTRGRAKIVADPQPLYRRVYRYWKGIFRFTL